MPTLLQVTAVAHAYGPVELKTNTQGKQYAQLRAWVSENTGKKDADGKPEKKFTSLSAFVNGKEAEWLAQSCRKGSLVMISGTARLDSFKKQDGTDSHSILISRVATCRVLDKDEAEQVQRPAAPAPSAPIGGGAGADMGSDEPPF
jgi:single-stranded DNA-binding protein